MYSVNGIFPGELSPDKTVAGCIDIFENVWPEPEYTIQAIEEQTLYPDSGIKWEPATIIGRGIDKNSRSNYHMGITRAAEEFDNPLAQNIHNQMYLLLLAATIPYAEKHGVKEMYHEAYNMLRYSGGQEYKSHFDGATDTGRSISAICYLNNDFSGGEIEFPNFDIKIKPQPGMLLVFPSNFAYSHIAHPVIDGTKYAIVTWIRDRKI